MENEAPATCDQLLDLCATVVEKQREAIHAQQEVIEKQDEVIQAQTDQVESEKSAKTIWTVLAIVEGAILAFILH